MEYVSEILPIPQLESYIHTFPELLNNLNIESCEFFWGWQCELPMDDLWKSKHITTSEIETILGTAINDKVFIPGDSDVYFESKEHDFKIQFCHHSDIHLETSSEKLAKSFFSSLVNSGYKIMHRVDNKWSDLEWA